MQSGVGPFVGVFLEERARSTGLISAIGLASTALWLAFGATVKKICNSAAIIDITVQTAG